MSETEITVIHGNNKLIYDAQPGTVLADLLAFHGIPVRADCGRRGSCGKCRVKVLSGTFDNEKTDENNTVRACKAVIKNSAVISTDIIKGDGLTASSDSFRSCSGVCGIAVDIGTTTIAAAKLHKNGKITYASALNPQSIYGADVISRINACTNGSLTILTGLIRSCINDIVNELDKEKEAEELVISGNTTMLHLFCGVSPESMGVYPFTPAFTDTQHPDIQDFGENIKKITVLPSVSAFVGSDITAGIYAKGLHKTDKTILFADLGTNGELVLSHKGKLYCTSTAAGPALEGACIECGMGGVGGAINRIYQENNEIKFSVIGDKTPNGICGAGLVDAIALLINKNLIDETGCLENIFCITDEVYISQDDIRQFQLAKSAIYSGIETLLEAAGITVSEVDTIMTAGGLGYYIDNENAFVSGLLPRHNNITATGNTSLQGAVMCLTDSNAAEEMQQITKNCTLVDLGGNPKFNERFMNNMFFL